MRRFTLTELVIVVVVLAGLCLLVGVGLGKAREKARRANCAGNMKCFGLACLMYTGDYAGYFPNIQANTTTSFQPLQVENYVQDGKVWACPSRPQVMTLCANSAYRYIGSGLKDDDKNAKTVSVAYDQSGNHPENNAWVNVLFIDGHAEGAEVGTRTWASND